MFCRKCGKRLDGEATICPECAEWAQVQLPTAGAAPVDRGSRKKGLGLGIAGAVTAIVGFILTYFALVYMSMLITELSLALEDPTLMIVEAEVCAACYGGIVIGALGVVCAIPAFVLGILSIVRAVKQKKRGQVLPIPALVLGIVATVFSALALLFFLIGGVMGIGILEGYTQVFAV